MPAASASVKTSRPSRKGKPKIPTISSEQRLQMIEEAAYFRAEQRSFQGGDPVGDWLLSEQEIDDLLSQDTH